jgi:predicted aldo/keto reductase-like oxidoreductase
MQAKRRTVLKGLLQGSALLGASPAFLTSGRAAQAAAAGPVKIQQYKPLGSTDLRISDISFGGSRLQQEPELISHALDLGINYFDTAESYTGGTSEETIGNALKGKRDRVYLTSKGHFSAHTSADEMMQTLESSLRRLQTDYIDVYFNHAVNDVERLKNEAFYTFTERAKQQGKIRYVGLSGHGGRLIECLQYAIARKAFDVMLVAYNFGQDPSFLQKFTRNFDFIAINQELPRVIKQAKAAGMGVVAMKTLRGAKLNDMAPYQRDGATFSQAAFRWVLSNPSVDALIVTMSSKSQIDEFVAASGHSKLSQQDTELLKRYVELHDSTYCRPLCDACEATCPEGVPIADVLRHKMYFEDYGTERMAMERYARLTPNAAACQSCAHQACLNACPYGLQIPTLTRRAHQLLQWNG